MHTNFQFAFASQEVQTIASRWQEEAEKKYIHEYVGIAYTANESSMIEI
jgi:hypothetical protein